jgi:hypothetical protein
VTAAWSHHHVTPLWRLASLALLVTFLASACRPAPEASPAAGVHVFLWGSFNTTDRDLQLAKNGGFTWVKQLFEWRNIERDAKGRFEWNEPDRIVNAAQAHGLKILARLDGYPTWSRSQQVYPDDGPPDRLSDWTDYVTAIATRYKGRIAAYEIWNEPNIDREWGGQPPDAAAYVALLKVSYDAIKRVDPAALVITAGLSPTTDTSARARPDATYLREMYAAGLKGSYDLLGVHAAGFRSPPEADPGAVALDPEATNHDPSPPEARRVYAFRHVEDLRQIMVEQGDGNKQVAVLEMGWTSDKRPGSPYLWYSTTEEVKGEYLARAFDYARKNWPWASFMTVIYLPDPAWRDDQEQLYWSITNRDGTPLPAYIDLKRVLAGN